MTLEFFQEIVTRATAADVATASTAALTAVLHDVVGEGGTIVRCREGVCEDLHDQERVGHGRDGYYVTFPNTPDLNKKLQKYQGRIRQALQNAES